MGRKTKKKLADDARRQRNTECKQRSRAAGKEERVSAGEQQDESTLIYILRSLYHYFSDNG
jgi:ribosomal protein L32E